MVSHRLEEAEGHRRGLDGLVLQDVPGLESPHTLDHLVRRDRCALQAANLPEQLLDDSGRPRALRPYGMHCQHAHVPMRHARSADVGHDTGGGLQ